MREELLEDMIEYHKELGAVKAELGRLAADLARLSVAVADLKADWPAGFCRDQLYLGGTQTTELLCELIEPNGTTKETRE
jgi:hypothetical protein